MKTRIQKAVELFLEERFPAKSKVLVWAMETENGIYFRLQNRDEVGTDIIRPGTPTYFVSAQEFVVIINSANPIHIFDFCLTNDALPFKTSDQTLFGFPVYRFDEAPVRAETWRRSSR